MNKQELLAHITTLSSQNLISLGELTEAFNNGQTHEVAKITRGIRLAQVLYVTGGIIVFLGIFVLISQNWDALNFFSRIIITFGLGILSFIIGLLLKNESKYGEIGYAFHLIAALTLPIGISVLFDEVGFDWRSNVFQSITSGIMLTLYLVSYRFLKKPFFTFFFLVFSTWFYFVVTNTFIDAYVEHRLLSVGLLYVLLGYRFSKNSQRALTGTLYTFGTLFILSSSMMLGGLEPNQSIIWEFAYPFVLAATLYLSVQLRSRSMLIIGTFFLMTFIMKVTSQYFTGVIGWPLSLVVAGLTIIGIGYCAYSLNKKYIATPIQNQT